MSFTRCGIRSFSFREPVLPPRSQSSVVAQTKKDPMSVIFTATLDSQLLGPEQPIRSNLCFCELLCIFNQRKEDRLELMNIVSGGWGCTCFGICLMISLAIESFGFWYYLIHFDSFFCIYLLQYFDIMLLLATCHASPRSSDRWAPPRSGRRRKFIARFAAWSHRCCDLASHVTTLRPTLVLAQTSRHLSILMLMVTNTNTTQ